jgi:hypothetical protein
MTVPRLDDWLPNPAVRTHHRRSSLVDADELWRAALGLQLSDTVALGRLIRWRIPDTPPAQTFGELFRSYPFTVLEEDRRLLVSGLCGRIWTLTGDYPALAGADAFRDWSEPGTVRVLFAHWIEPAAPDEVQLVSEARVDALDRGAALRLRALWAAVGPFERLVGSEALGAAVRRAESQAPAPRAANARR